MTLEIGLEWLMKCRGLTSVEQLFPWQRALLEQMVKSGFPEVLDIPTGLGKTSVMSIWLVARALGAPVPRRLIYVVDRRVIVDQATVEAEKLRHVVEENPSLRHALRLTKPLHIATLRGAHADDKEWRRDLTAPAICVGTVDMIGSRLLFNGYGVSRKMRPVHAGLLGCDAAFVLDEAHLARPFQQLLEEIRKVEWRAAPALPDFRVLSMTATSARPGGFGLTKADHGHPTISRRLNASKSLIVRPRIEPGELANALVKEARDHASLGPARILVYCHKRRDAVKVGDALRKTDADVELLVGGRRVRERERVMEWLLGHGFLASAPRKPDRTAFLVATSAGEVGVDLDADHAVMDVVAWERMLQRLGRVNRLGDGAATVVAIPTEDETTRLLQEAVLDAVALLPERGNGRDASSMAISALRDRALADEKVRVLIDSATTPEPLRPQLTRATAEAWAMTSLREHPGRPSVAPWLRGWAEEEPKTTLIWRRRLPVREDGSFLGRALEKYFDAAPPHLTEGLEIEAYVASEWLVECAKALPEPSQFFEDGGIVSEVAPVAFFFSRTGELRGARRLHELRASSPRDIMDLLIEAFVVIDARLAGLAEDGLLNSKFRDLPATGDDGPSWSANGIDGSSQVGFRIREAASDDPGGVDPRWKEYARLELGDLGEDATRLLIIERLRGDLSAEDDASVRAFELLEAHSLRVGHEAKAITEALGISEDLERVFLLAARKHDDGKASARWQRAFRTDRAPEPGVYAKAPGPVNTRLLAGYRHEFGSVLAAERSPDLQGLSQQDRDLALHLIAAHHGRGRPHIEGAGTDMPAQALDGKAAQVAVRFAELQEAWGIWGLAWMEAVLRMADHKASAEDS